MHMNESSNLKRSKSFKKTVIFQKKPATTTSPPAQKSNGTVEVTQQPKPGSVSPSDNNGKENKELSNSQEDSDEQDDGRKKRVNKQKWVPLEIDLAKNRGKRERSPRHHYHKDRTADGRIKRKKVSLKKNHLILM